MNNEKVIELYVLNGCSKCSTVKQKLTEEGLVFSEINCTSTENEDCDKLEDSINCGRYPIAIVKNKGVKSIIHTCYDKKNTAKSKKIPADSIESFLSEIKKAYF